MSLSYSNDLWAGIKVVYDHYEEGRDTLGFLISFLKERISAEEKHASKLEKQASKSTGWTETGTLGASWKAIKDWQEASAKHLATVASQLQNSIVTPLTTFKKDQERQKDLLHKEVDKLEASMAKMRDLLSKAKAKYVKACADFEKATLDHRAADPVGTKPKEMEKLRTKVQSDKVSADQAHDAYKQQIAEHRTFQTKYEEQFRNILQQFGEAEMKRRDQIKELFVLFLDTQDHYARAMTETVIPLRSAIEALDSGADLQALLEAKKTGLHPEPLVEYEPYVSDNQVEVPADAVENGTRANAPDLQRTRSKSMKPMGDGSKKISSSSSINKEEKKDKDKKKDKSSKTETADPGSPPPALVAPPSDPTSPAVTHQESSSAPNATAKKLDRSESSSSAAPATAAGSEAAATKDASPSEVPSIATTTTASKNDTTGAEEPTSPKSVTSDDTPRSKKDKSGGGGDTTTESAPKSADKKVKSPRKKKEKRPPVARASFEYDATDDTEISFKEGELIIVQLYDGEVPDCPGWMKGKCKGKEGLFPANHVDLQPDFKLCKATYDFDVTEAEELGLKEGDILIIEATHEDWFEGQNEKGETGIFPATYVVLL